MDATLQRSFESFFDEQYGALFRALCLITGDPEEAEDITQDAFVRVWERWSRVSLMERPDGYLFRTAMNLFRKKVRHAHVAARCGVEAAQADDLAGIEDRDECIRALRTLSEQQRAALILSGLLGYSTDEIGLMLGCRTSTVRVHLSRGRGAIRRRAGCRERGR